MNKNIGAFLLALPALIVISFFKLFPAVQSIRLSFKNYNILKGISESKSSGLDNFAIMSFMLAYLLRFSKILYPLFLVILFSLTNNFVGEYLVYQQYGMIDTIYPIIFSSAFSIVGAFALHFSISCSLKGEACNFEDYFRLALRPLTVILVLVFITSWGSFFCQTIFTTNVLQQGVGMYAYRMIMSQSFEGITDIRTAIIYVSSIVPATLGALLIFLNKYLPLTAFGAHIKRH